MQNNLHRWYDSATGQWISQDPIGFASGDDNLYRYVGNTPTEFTDPAGLLQNSGDGDGDNGAQGDEREDRRTEEDFHEQDDCQIGAGEAQGRVGPLGAGTLQRGTAPTIPGPGAIPPMVQPPFQDNDNDDGWTNAIGLLLRKPRPHRVQVGPFLKPLPALERRPIDADTVNPGVGKHAVIRIADMTPNTRVGTEALITCIGVIVRERRGPRSHIYVFHFRATDTTADSTQIYSSLGAGRIPRDIYVFGGDGSLSSDQTLEQVFTTFRRPESPPLYIDTDGLWIDQNGVISRFRNNTPNKIKIRPGG